MNISGILISVALLLTLFTCPALAISQVNVGLADVIASVEKSFRVDSSGRSPISDFSADFFQRTILGREGREMRGEGHVSVRMPAGDLPLMFHFEYFRPSTQEIVCDGRSMWIYHPQNREVILSDVRFLFNRLSFEPNRDRAVNFLQGLDRISKDFQINYASGMQDAGGNYILELTPRRAMLNTRRILMVVSQQFVLAQLAGNSANRFAPEQKQPAPAVRAPQNSSKGVPSAASWPTTVAPPLGTPSDLFPILSTTIEDHEGNSTTMEFGRIQVNRGISTALFTFIVPGDVQVVRPSEQNLPR